MKKEKMKVSQYVVKMLQKFSPNMPIHKTNSGVWTAKDVALKLLAQEQDVMYWLADVLRIMVRHISREVETKLMPVDITPYLADASQLDKFALIKILKEPFIDDYAWVFRSKDGIPYTKRAMLDILEADTSLAHQYMANCLAKMNFVWELERDELKKKQA